MAKSNKIEKLREWYQEAEYVVTVVQRQKLTANSLNKPPKTDPHSANVSRATDAVLWRMVHFFNLHLRQTKWSVQNLHCRTTIFTELPSFPMQKKKKSLLFLFNFVPQQILFKFLFVKWISLKLKQWV